MIDKNIFIIILGIGFTTFLFFKYMSHSNEKSDQLTFYQDDDIIDQNNTNNINNTNEIIENLETKSVRLKNNPNVIKIITNREKIN